MAAVLNWVCKMLQDIAREKGQELHNTWAEGSDNDD